MKIGFIGLGIMGSRMAMNLRKAGYELVVHNRTRSSADELLAAGAEWADSPAALAASCDIVITMLASPEVVQAAATGEGGFLASMRKGALWMDCSTVDPAFSREMAGQAVVGGIEFLDAPVAGTKAPAESGDLLFLVGGSDANLSKVQPLLNVMGRKTLHLGGHGAGASMKMLINGLLAQSMLAFAEAVTLGQAMGFPRGKVMDVLLATPITPAFLDGVRPKIENADDDPNFPLKWMHKDLHLAATTAYNFGVAMPSLNAAKEAYALAKQAGFAEKDFSAIYEFISSKM